MQIALLRVGIDTGSGGIHGPLFRDGTFEYIPIPDGSGEDERTYGNTAGRYGRKLLAYFPEARRARVADQSIHFDPEFVTFTYGDPTAPKAGLRNLKKGDMLVFYCGLQGWDFKCEPALYLIGYLEIAAAGMADAFGPSERNKLFAVNFHVRHRRLFERQRKTLVLIKGGRGSRLLRVAKKISTLGRDRTGKALKVLSPEMQNIFGNFNGRISIQRSPTRWVDPDYAAKAAEFVRLLP